MIGRLLSRFPRAVTTLILAVLAVSIWEATVYVETVVRPREAAAREAMIAREIGRADKLFARAKYETALSEYGYVLTGFVDELSMEVQRRLHDRVGTCLVELAVAGNEEGSFERGIDSYHAALALIPEPPSPAASEIWYRIGKAYMAQSRMTGEAAMADAAANAFETGLSALSAERNAGRYATGLRLTGNAHRRLHELNPEQNPMDNVMRFYQEALRIAGPVEEPVAHGETLSEIARAHILLAERGYRHRQLREAIESFERVLAVFTVEAFPERHAATHKEMGDTYTVMSELGPRNRSDRAAHLQRVLRYQNKAKQSYRIAKSFGFEPGFSVAGGEQETPIVEEKKE